MTRWHWHNSQSTCVLKSLEGITGWQENKSRGICKERVPEKRPEGLGEGGKDRRRAFQAEGTKGVGAPPRGPGKLCRGAGESRR